LSTPYYLRNG